MSNDKFDLDIHLVREWDSEIDQIVEEFMPLALEFTAKGPIPKTCSVFLSFIASTEFIKNGILDHADAENVYAAKILFRSLIEHYLRFQYIWFRVSEEKSDAAAEDYLKHGMFKESLQIARSWKRVAKILGRDSCLSPYDAVRSVIKATTAYSNKEIDERSSQFEYARIIEYIFGKMKRRESEEVPFLLKILPSYSDLSCFVHGSPGAISIMGSLQGKGELAADLLNTAALAFQTAGSVKLFSLLTFCQYDRKFSSPYLKVDKLLRLVGRPSQPAE
jgi:hypothetical protein